MDPRIRCLECTWGTILWAKVSSQKVLGSIGHGILLKFRPFFWGGVLKAMVKVSFGERFSFCNCPFSTNNLQQFKPVVNGTTLPPIFLGK